MLKTMCSGSFLAYPLPSLPQPEAAPAPRRRPSAPRVSRLARRAPTPEVAPDGDARDLRPVSAAGSGATAGAVRAARRQTARRQTAEQLQRCM